MLLIYDSVTDLCLSCHATAYGSVMSYDPLNPPPELGGGNFTFLLEDNLNDGMGGQMDPIAGNHAGHNVVASLWEIPVDPDHSMAPGGDYSSEQLSCISCHDPHGNDNYRMLHGVGPISPGGYEFIYPAPAAEGLALSDGPESATNHAAYTGGWTDWCANCHGFFHDEEGTSSFEHTVDEVLSDEERLTYNEYDGPLNPDGGQYSTAYIPQVPLEDPAMTTDGTFGAGGSSRISCLSCHRAHATSAPSSTRWDTTVRLLQMDGRQSGSYPLPNPYPAGSQLALCVKCHARVVLEKPHEHDHGHPCLSCHRESVDRLNSYGLRGVFGD